MLLPARRATPYALPAESVSLCPHCRLPAPAGGYCCYGCELAARIAGQASADGTAVKARLMIAAFLTMNLMVFTLVLYGDDVYEGPDAATWQKLADVWRWAAALLAAPVMLILAPPLARSAWRRLRAGTFSADLLIVAGASAAFVASLRAVVRGEGAVTFDTAAMILVLTTAGRALESAARSGASAALSRQLGIGGSCVAVRAPDGSWSDRSVGSVEVGDVVRVPVGGAAPVDGVILEGHADVSEAILTGESRLRVVGPDDPLSAGAVAESAALVIRAISDVHGSAVGRLAALVEDARRRRAPVERIADRLAAALVPGVVVVAGVSFVWAAAQVSMDEALTRALGVVLVACPCGFGLATPLALWVALGRAASAGVLVRGADVLERTARVRTVVLDKTGTVTEQQPEVVAIRAEPGESDVDLLALAAGLEAHALHPIGDAIRGEAERQRVAPAIVVDVVRTSDGLAGTAGGAGVSIGRADGERIAVHRAGRRLGVIELSERIRSDAFAAVAELRSDGISVELASGDDEARAAAAANRLGIAHRARQTSADKLASVDAVERSGRAVAMVGDGMNDAPALERATVGIALGTGADLARAVAPVSLIRADLRLVPWVLALARRTRRIIRQNLAWAFFYNGICVALAATGLLRPVLAAVAMVLSSLLVLGNSFRMGRFPPPGDAG